MLPSRTAAAWLLFLWCGAHPVCGRGNWNVFCWLYTFRFFRCSFWKREALTGAEFIGFSVNESLPHPKLHWWSISRGGKAMWLNFSARKRRFLMRAKRLVFRWKDFSLGDGNLDAQRRPKGPSEHRINGEKASGFEGVLPGAAIWSEGYENLWPTLLWGTGFSSSV